MVVPMLAMMSMIKTPGVTVSLNWNWGWVEALADGGPARIDVPVLMAQMAAGM